MVRVKEAPPGKATLKGKVLGILGMAVAGADVELNGTKKKTLADGSFTMRNIPLGSYTLTVEHWAYNTYEEDLDLTEEKTYTVDVKLGLKMMVMIPVGMAALVGGVWGGKAVVEYVKK